MNSRTEFVPLFCPNPGCRSHYKASQKRTWLVRYSFYFCEKENKRYQRFMCLGCKKTFSRRAFESDYCLKLNLSYRTLFAPLKINMSVKSWTKAIKHGAKVIENRLRRLIRWLCFKGFLSKKQAMGLSRLGLVEQGLFYKRLWIKASCPEHRSELSRCFLKQLRSANNDVDIVKFWTLLSWSYYLIDKHYYRPAFTFY